MRQAVNEIDVDGGDARGAEFGDDAPCRLESLRAVDGGLHLGVEILHADADAVDTGLAEGRDAVATEPARIDLDGELRVFFEVEARPQLVASSTM